MVVREEEGGNDLTSSYLSCRLVLASLHIEEGEVYTLIQSQNHHN